MLVRARLLQPKARGRRVSRAPNTKDSKPKGNFGRGQNCLLANDLKKIENASIYLYEAQNF